MNKETYYDLIGIGAGPFNLSLLSLMQKSKLKSLLIEKSPEVRWHSEISFKDSIMQTSYLKDLVTSVDPTNHQSFLNYLVKTGKFYLFMNTSRTVVTRREYEDYLKWVSLNLNEQIQFQNEVKEIKLNSQDQFEVLTDKNQFSARALCIGTGVSPRIPEFARSFLGKNCFHAKSAEILDLDITGKNVVIIGGGQTGLEIFRNALHHKWGAFQSIKILSRRSNLLPLDESPFTNEYFTPSYVHCFYKLDDENKERFLSEQKLASDGNTPTYLLDLYRDLYQIKLLDKDQRTIEIMPNRQALRLTQGNGPQGIFDIEYVNQFTKKNHSTKADIIILASGFESVLPDFLNPISDELCFDEDNRLIVNMDFRLKFKNAEKRKNSPLLFVQNYSKHMHGISEPQTSLMPWRSATIINTLTKNMSDNTLYELNQEKTNFINFCRDE